METPPQSGPHLIPVPSNGSGPRDEDAFLAIDLGTTTIKAALFNDRGKRLAISEVFSPVRRYRMPDGTPAATMDFRKTWDRVIGAVRSVVSERPGGTARIKAIGLSSQAQTFAPVDENGKLMGYGISWLDERAWAEAALLEAKFGRDEFYRASGFNGVSPALLVSKLLWMRENKVDVWRGAKRFALLRDYILFRMTGKWVSDPSLLGIGGLYHLTEDRVFTEMLDFLGLPRTILPEPVAPDHSLGVIRPKAARDFGIPEGVLAVPGCLDQICAGIGLGNDAPGTVSENSGTCMTLFATTPEVVPDPEKRFPFGRHVVPKWGFLLPYIPAAGSVFEWMAREIGRETVHSRMEREAEEVGIGCDGVRMIPHFQGMVSPGENPRMRGLFAGLQLHHTRGHLFRACLESLAFSLRENLEALEPLLGTHASPAPDVVELRIEKASKESQVEAKIFSGGGGAVNRVWLQIKADVLGRPIFAPAEKECSLLGAAILARCAANEEPLWQAARQMVMSDLGMTFRPRDTDLYEEAYRDYLRLCGVMRGYFGEGLP